MTPSANRDLRHAFAFQDDVALTAADASTVTAEPPHLPPDPPALDAALIESALARVVASALFRRSPRHQKLLRHIFTKAVSGNTAALKESLLAWEVFGLSPSSFDPARDTIVRVEMRRLRKRLQQSNGRLIEAELERISKEYARK